jgi:hypothetical protein
VGAENVRHLQQRTARKGNHGLAFSLPMAGGQSVERALCNVMTRFGRLGLAGLRSSAPKCQPGSAPGEKSSIFCSPGQARRTTPAAAREHRPVRQLGLHMIEIHKRDRDGFHYWRAWRYQRIVVLHWGRVGERGRTHQIRLRKGQTAQAVIEEAARKPIAEGYSARFLFPVAVTFLVP